MNLKFLETFIWVAKLRSFSLAAEKLHSTQAAISSRILALETELDAKLFTRDPKGATLTREGERVLQHAEQISTCMTRLRGSLQDQRLAAGAIRIGAMDSAIHSWFIDFVADANRAYPNLDVEVTVDTALNLNEQLRRGLLDLVFQTDVLRDESIRSVELFQLPMAFVATALPPMDMRALVKHRLITYSRHSRPHQDLVRHLESHGLSDARISCVNSLAAMIKLTQTGFGICAMPPAVLPSALPGPALHILRGVEAPPSMPFVAAWRSGSEWPERLLAVANDTIRAYFDRLDPARRI